jgi:hypothetical protein
MPVFSCNNCNKKFNRKSNYEYHINDKVKPCGSDNIDTFDKNVEHSPKSQNIIENKEITINDLILRRLDELINPNLENIDSTTCVYCNKFFTRVDNLQRHLKERCKSKKNHDELEKLKIRLSNIVVENEKFKKEIIELKHTNNNVTNMTNNISNILNKNQINNGTINNNVNVQLVQFGSENIDDIDSDEALTVYYKSTGGNILSNVFKLVNLNENYPQNHNICISDLSREIVRIFNGKKFVVKKFKNVEGEIMSKVIKNTYKLVDKIENDDSIVLSSNIISKLRINNISLRLINGDLPEDIVRDEIREKDKLLKNNTDVVLFEDENKSNNSKEERDYNLEELLRIDHLTSKQQGLIDISLERLKEELYNGKDLVENSEKIIKHKKKKYVSVV